MKAFKYLVFFILSIITTSTFSAWKIPSSTLVFPTPAQAYAAYHKVSVSSVTCVKWNTQGTQYSCNHGGGGMIVILDDSSPSPQ